MFHFCHHDLGDYLEKKVSEIRRDLENIASEKLLKEGNVIYRDEKRRRMSSNILKVITNTTMVFLL